MADLTDKKIEAGWRATFSTNNPFCPCDLKSFTKAVRWAERALSTAGTKQEPLGAAEAVAEIIECSVKGQQTVREIDGRWKFLPYGTLLYAAPEVGAQLVHYFAEWEQILPPDAREALRAIVDQTAPPPTAAAVAPELESLETGEADAIEPRRSAS